MANNQEQVNGEDFSQDVNASEEEHLNGSDQGAAGEKQNGDSNGSAAEAPGRDDDRYEIFFYLCHIKTHTRNRRKQNEMLSENYFISIEIAVQEKKNSKKSTEKR